MTSKVARQQVPCGLCGADKYHPLHIIKGFRIVQCKECGCIYTRPRAIWDYSTGSNNFDEELDNYRECYLPHRQASADKYWAQLNRYRQTNHLLDVGSGYGFFLHSAQQHGWEPRGVEMAFDQAAWCRQHFHIQIEENLNSTLLQPGLYDVLTLWDVIEHVSDPRDFLRHCYDLLRPGGGILLKTPNADALLLNHPWWQRPYLKLYVQLGYPANPIEHPYHFTLDFMQTLVEEIGFKIVSTENHQRWNEWVVVGRTKLIKWARQPLLRFAQILRLPYQQVILAEKPSTLDERDKYDS